MKGKTMKVHIAYDDGTLIGVYETREAADDALMETALRKAERYGSSDALYRAWIPEGSSTETRDIITLVPPHEWEQLIDTYEVQK